MPAKCQFCLDFNQVGKAIEMEKDIRKRMKENRIKWGRWVVEVPLIFLLLTPLLDITAFFSLMNCVAVAGSLVLVFTAIECWIRNFKRRGMAKVLNELGHFWVLIDGPEEQLHVHKHNGLVFNFGDN